MSCPSLSLVFVFLVLRFASFETSHVAFTVSHMKRQLRRHTRANIPPTEFDAPPVKTVTEAKPVEEDEVAFDDNVRRKLELHVRAGTCSTVVQNSNASLKTQYRAMSRYHEIEACQQMGLDAQLLLGFHFRNGRYEVMFSQTLPRRLNPDRPYPNIIGSLERDVGTSLTEWATREANALTAAVAHHFEKALLAGVTRGKAEDDYTFDKEKSIRYFVPLDKDSASVKDVNMTQGVCDESRVKGSENGGGPSRKKVKLTWS